MVVGRGLIANSFGHFNNDDSIIIFASGVSNSGEVSESEYIRELELIKSFIKTNKKFVYFSTISVFDKSLQNSGYIEHKTKIEKIIEENFPLYNIFRLPIVVGKTNNRNTLTNYLFNKINNGEKLQVFKQACRYLLDIEDVSFLCTKIIGNIEFNNKVINSHFNNKITIPSLIEIFEKVTKREAVKEYVEKGDCYEPDNSIFIQFIRSVNYEVPSNYNDRLIEKYYS